LRQFVVVAERDGVERAGQLAVAAEDAAAHVDLVDAGVALAGRVALLLGVLRRDHADAVGRAGGGAQRAADALLEAVLVPVQAVAATEARVDGPLVLGVLLRDGLPEEVPERDREALDGVGDWHVSGGLLVVVVWRWRARTER